MTLDIKTNSRNGGLYCFFEYGGQEYAEDLCDLMFHPDDSTECMVFKAKDGRVVDWNDLYCKRNIPVTEAALTECVEEFIASLESKK